jgi:TonB family protein
LVVAGQAAAIFWLGDRTPSQPRQPDREPVFALARGPSVAWLEELNPTLFAWSGPHGFSGAAWLRGKPPANQPFAWAEPARFLAPDPKQLAHQAIGAEGRPARPPMESAPGRLADMKLPLRVWPDGALWQRSTVRVEGELAGRPLLTPLAPPSQPVNDVLPDTEVRVLVDATGLVRSATLLASSSLSAVDAKALELARAARFAPLAAAPWQAGKLVFRWHTVPAPAAAAPEVRP